MNIKNRQCWQIAAGNGDTHYARLCITHDIAIVGPGKHGAWPSCKNAVLQSGRTPQTVGMIRRFAEEIQKGDIVVLRIGTQEIYGVGVVEGNYQWLSAFNDVQGWDLQHTRRVRWLWRSPDVPKRFPTYTLKLGSTVQKLISLTVMDWITTLPIPDQEFTRELAPLPDATITEAR